MRCSLVKLMPLLILVLWQCRTTAPMQQEKRESARPAVAQTTPSSSGEGYSSLALRTQNSSKAYLARVQTTAPAHHEEEILRKLAAHLAQRETAELAEQFASSHFGETLQTLLEARMKAQKEALAGKTPESPSLGLVQPGDEVKTSVLNSSDAILGFGLGGAILASSGLVVAGGGVSGETYDIGRPQ